MACITKRPLYIILLCITLLPSSFAAGPAVGRPSGEAGPADGRRDGTADPASPVDGRHTGTPAPLTAEDVVGIESIRDVEISPDGSLVVWVKSAPDAKKNTRRNDIFLTRLADTVTIRLTRGSGGDRSPHFSPDGAALAFLRTAGKSKPQIYLIRMDGGEPEKLTSAQAGVRGFSWAGPGEILFTAREDSTLREERLVRDKDNALIVADQEHYAPVRLFGIGTDSKKVRRLTLNGGGITEFAVSPGGRFVVTNENQSVDYDYDRLVPPKQFLLDLETGERREILREPHVDPFGFGWNTEGTGFYCFRPVSSDTTDTYVGIRQLYYYDTGADRLTPVDLEWDRGTGYSYGIIRDGLVVPLLDGTGYRMAHARRKGRGYRKRLFETATGKRMTFLASRRTGDLVVYSVADASSIPVVYAASIVGGKLKNERPIVRLNEKLVSRNLARSEVVRWRGALGEEVEGILYYPLEYREGERHPLVVDLHGGPAGVDLDFFSERWSNYPHLLASRGTFVLKVNYHGSAGYGLAWVESIKEHYYEYEIPDIMAGIDHLVAGGFVDAGRIGIMGWSNGSILAIECCLRSDRFKALCAGAGDVNWISDYGNCAFGAAFDNAYLGGPPWEQLETYIAKSPIFRMNDLVTPTLIMFGANDTSVPTEQGWQHFRAVQQTGAAPVRFLLFPGATHGLSKLSHQKRKIEEELAWLDRHLFETYEEPDESLAEHSPLALIIERSKAAGCGGMLGERVGDVLVPETVPCTGMRVGRFEVTRAQYASFEPEYRYPAGTENYPACGVTFERSRDYCAWLSERTGRTFRLPAEEEMKKLLESAAKNLAHENTLDYWAGYAPTPGECARLAHRIEGLGDPDLFIREAGSFRPVGSMQVYDLGGNVAEWAAGGDAGKVMGLSAVSAVDTRSEYEPPPPEYVGFRILEVE